MNVYKLSHTNSAWINFQMSVKLQGLIFGSDGENLSNMKWFKSHEVLEMTITWSWFKILDKGTPRTLLQQKMFSLIDTLEDFINVDIMLKH